MPCSRRRAADLLETLGIAALIEFLATLKSFPLWVEVPTQALGDRFGGGVLREFLLSIWLTPVAHVFVYGFVVMADYQGSFRRMRRWNKEGGFLPQRLAVLTRANAALGKLRLLSGLAAQRIARKR